MSKMKRMKRRAIEIYQIDCRARASRHELEKSDVAMAAPSAYVVDGRRRDASRGMARREKDQDKERKCLP